MKNEIRISSDLFEFERLGVPSSDSMRIPKHILPVIVTSQFFCTSLWFAGNGIINDLSESFNLTQTALGDLTSAVQLGFIIGTLIFALFTISDRFSPSKVFLVCALIGSLFNLGVIWEGNSLLTLIAFRFCTGFFLAGIYPVGMKIASDYYEKGLGLSLGYLVGALVVGTAFPHLLKDLSSGLPWRSVIMTTSMLAVLGGISMWLWVPDGPARRAGKGIDLSAFSRVFRKRSFRLSAFGYFGHMWELYTFWAFVPVILQFHFSRTIPDINVPFWAFVTIGIGGPSCILAGYLSRSIGPSKTALLALMLSGCCCLVAPVVVGSAVPSWAFFVFLILWGVSVIADSPMLSTLVAQNAEASIKGTALTIVNSIGFAITIVSIQLISRLLDSIPISYVLLALVPGPIFGVISLVLKDRASSN